MTKLLLLGSFLVACFAAGAQSQGQMSRRVDTTSIPADIAAKDYVLLVHCPYNQKSWLKDFDKEMREHYTGAYQVIPWKTDIPAEYSDSSKYRYVLTVNQKLSDHYYFNNANKTVFNPDGYTNMGIVHRHLYIYDRKTGKTTDSGLESQNVLKILGFYADRMSHKPME